MDSFFCIHPSQCITCSWHFWTFKTFSVHTFLDGINSKPKGKKNGGTIYIENPFLLIFILFFFYLSSYGHGFLLPNFPWWITAPKKEFSFFLFDLFYFNGQETFLYQSILPDDKIYLAGIQKIAIFFLKWYLLNIWKSFTPEWIFFERHFLRLHIFIFFFIKYCDLYLLTVGRSFQLKSFFSSP